MSCNGLWVLQVLFSSVAMLSFAQPMCLSFSGIGMWPSEDRICACFYVAKENRSSMVTTPLFVGQEARFPAGQQAAQGCISEHFYLLQASVN